MLYWSWSSFLTFEVIVLWILRMRNENVAVKQVTSPLAPIAQYLQSYQSLCPIDMIFLRQGSNERDNSSPTERSGPVILSEAKDLSASTMMVLLDGLSITCHPERSEGSLCLSRQTLRSAEA